MGLVHVQDEGPERLELPRTEEAGPERDGPDPVVILGADWGGGG